jgi:hypothetical protein
LLPFSAQRISPYVFCWQTAQEIEDMHLAHEKPLVVPEHDTRGHLQRMAIDTNIGMAFSNGIAFASLLTTAATLHETGITNIATAADAAEALRPLAGPLTFALFSLGIIGTGLLAVPVLAGYCRLRCCRSGGGPAFKSRDEAASRARLLCRDRRSNFDWCTHRIYCA